MKRTKAKAGGDSFVAAEDGVEPVKTLQGIVVRKVTQTGAGRKVRGDIKSELAEDSPIAIDALLIGEPECAGPPGNRDIVGGTDPKGSPLSTT